MAVAISDRARSGHFGWPSVTSPAANTDHADQALVAAAQAGDRAAFGALYQRYARMVHGILLGRVPHLAVDDMVQDVFLHILPRLASLRDVSRFGPWLAATTRNLAADFHRRSKPVVSLEENYRAAQAQETPVSGVTTEDQLALLNAVRELPETYREPLILRFVEGMTGPEIAAHLGMEHGSVRVNLHRGMQLLRQKWGSACAPARNEKGL